MSDNQAGIYREKMTFEGNFVTIPNNWIRKTGLTPTANFLLIYLMTHEIGYEILFSQIERETQIHEKAFRTALKELVEAGWVTAIRTKKANGQLGAYRYTISDPTTPPQGSLAQATMAEATMAEGSVIKKTNLEKTNTKKTNKDIYSEFPMFLEFWDAYPRKSEKMAAFKAWQKALDLVSAEELLEAAKKHAADPNLPLEQTFIKHPATWLNKGCWEDAPLPKRFVAPAQQAEIVSKQRQDARERALAATKEFLAEYKVMAAQAAPPPVCEHGKNLVRCRACLDKLKPID